MKETSEKLRNTEKGMKNLAKFSPCLVSLQGGSFPSGFLSDQQLSDFLNFYKLHAVPWLPMKHCAFAASESCLFPVLSSISALALAAGSLFPYLVFCDHAQMLLGKE